MSRSIGFWLILRELHLGGSEIVRVLYGLEVAAPKRHGQVDHPDQQQMGAKQEQFASTYVEPV